MNARFICPKPSHKVLFGPISTRTLSVLSKSRQDSESPKPIAVRDFFNGGCYWFVKIKTLLKRYKYPPDQQASAVETVLLQAETLGEDLVVEAA